MSPNPDFTRTALPTSPAMPEVRSQACPAMLCKGFEGERTMPAHLTEIKVRDVRVRLHRAGHGPKVLFLHGAGGVPQWLAFFEALAERYEVLVPEHPGFGGSDDPPWIHSMPDLAMFYLALVGGLG